MSSPEEMRKIFYYGTDGQLYFTDDFLSQFRAIVDESSFNQGVFLFRFVLMISLFNLLLVLVVFLLLTLFLLAFLVMICV